jgi:hypothetical protein
LSRQRWRCPMSYDHHVPMSYTAISYTVHNAQRCTLSTDLRTKKKAPKVRFLARAASAGMIWNELKVKLSSPSCTPHTAAVPML